MPNCMGYLGVELSKVLHRAPSVYVSKNADVEWNHIGSIF